jgi:hypothetical protein
MEDITYHSCTVNCEVLISLCVCEYFISHFHFAVMPHLLWKQKRFIVN